MTNKLPVVGKIYRYKGDLTNEAFRHFFTSNSSFKFHEWFEELPEDNQTIKDPICDEKCTSVDKESIWKPVADLNEFITEYPKNTQQVIIKLKDGTYEVALGIHQGSLCGFQDISCDEIIDEEVIKEYCTLESFINQYNSLLDRVERLERILSEDR